MKQFGGPEAPKKPEMDAVDREAHEMFMESAVDALQEALHIDRAVKLLEEQIQKGVLNPRMTIEEAMEALETKKAGLVGGDAEEDKE
ncbi:MAG: hypothetical protein Q8Q41_02835 [bacterium]|nr:hypothetical protein [bacterium]